MRVILCLLLVVVMIGGPSPASAKEAGSDQCKVETLSEDHQPGWTVSGTWLDGDTLALVDTLNNSILRYTPQKGYVGRELESLRGGVVEAVGEFLPTSIQSSEGVTWLELTGGRFISVHGDSEIGTTLELRGRATKSSRTISAVFDWTVADHALFGFGNLRDQQDAWSTGFFKVDLDNPSDAWVVEELPRYPPERLWYRLGFQFLANVGDTAYALDFDERLWLTRSRPGVEGLDHLASMPDELMSLPELFEFTSPKEYIKLMRAVEKMTVPTGLHGWEGDVYLVWHKYQQGAHKWYLSRIDPDRDELLGTAELPSAWNHLMVVPGPEYWALVEKGPVVGYGLQSVRAIRYVPAAMIREIEQNARICQ